jgi:hypothetical protein
MLGQRLPSYFNIARDIPEPILDRALFDAVQQALASQARSRSQRCINNVSFLVGRIYDDGGNRMTPSTANKGESDIATMSHAPSRRRASTTRARSHGSQPRTSRLSSRKRFTAISPRLALSSPIET